MLEAHAAPGDVWRQRWDSLRLFTPVRFNGLPGMRLPGPQRYCPTAGEFANYLDDYADHFAVPLNCGETAVRISTSPDAGFTVTTKTSAGERVRGARKVVVATGGHTAPAIPSEASTLDDQIAQLHTNKYRRPEDLPGKRVLIVGCGASGVQLGVELAKAGREVTVAGRPTPSIPAPLLAAAGPVWFSFIHRVLTRATPIGRKAAPKVVSSGSPLIGISVRDLDRHNVHRGPRFTGTVNGLPQLADGKIVEVDAVLWATGYRPGLDWIDDLSLDAHGLPVHDRGISGSIPGLAFMGLPFQFGLTSTLIAGAGRDAAFLAAQLASESLSPDA
ncbi:oxidoreductase [Micromonospora qiuiae]|uniref:Oxidoreductase n=1 Tax=Micromonospora qiuiae TaxID=502268 RepID=A0ABQ4JLB9_9ACTN|nr:oxidoreductase [Micromonospora qiuiae]